MDAKLIKVEDEWYNLLKSDGELIASDDEVFQHNYKVSKLSTKNCQAIERGYDLDELAYHNSLSYTWLESDKRDEVLISKYSIEGFKEGFQKALELLADKKYSGADIKESYLSGVDDAMDVKYDPNATIDDEKYLKSLQQKEWDVEIEMICPHPQDTYRCGIQYGCDEDGCNHPNQVPYLDKDGCLILKRK